MEKPIPPNPDTMTDEEFDKWLEAEFIWESEQIAWQEFVAKAKEKDIWRED